MSVFWLVTAHIARNQIGSGVRRSWKIVPAVTDVWSPQAAHCISPRSRSGQAFVARHRGQRNPSGHRSRIKYSRHAVSVPKRRSNSARSRGKSSTRPYAICWGYRSQVNSQLLRFLRPKTASKRGGSVQSRNWISQLVWIQIVVVAERVGFEPERIYWNL